MLKQGEILKKLRIERDLTQEELGKYIGVSGQSINNWENDRRKYVCLSHDTCRITP